MDIFLVSVLVMGVAIILTVSWKLLNWMWFKPKKVEKMLREQGFSGNSYRLFSGDWQEASAMLKDAISKPISLSDDITTRIIPFQRQCIKKYGKNSFTWVGPKPSVHILNPEHIKDILSNENNFPKPVVNPLGRLLSRGLAALEGQKWAKHRKLLNPAFHMEKLKQMLPAFCQSCIELIDKWESLFPEEKSLELDVWPYLLSLTGDGICRTAFGSSYQEGKRIFDLQREQARLLVDDRQSFYIPWWSFLPTKTSRRMKELSKEIETSLRGIINRREEAMKAEKSTNNDLLGILMESNMNEMQDNGAKMSIDEVIEECKLFYFAGQETMADLLVWTMILLSQHQQWQVEARKEVLQVFGKKKPDFDGLSHLKIITMVLYEVLRLYPPGSVIFRTTRKETKLGSWLLPPEVQLYMPVILVHRDPELWGDDAEEFRPDRFSEGISKATKGQLCFYPFSWGPRICIGQNFALIEAKIALAMILQHFSFELSPSYTHAPFQILTVQPQYGAHIILYHL